MVINLRPRTARRWRTALSGVALITAAAVLAGCAGGAGDAPAPAAATSEEPVVGGTLRHRIPADPACLDPAQIRLRAALGALRGVVDSLTFQREDGGIEPWLAESYEMNADATEFTFVLQDGVVFSDGTPLTAQTVADNLQSLKDMGATASIAAPYLAAFAGAEALDDLTVVARFSSPQAQFLQATSTPTLGIVSEATLALDPGARCADGVIGTGPFVVDSYRPNEGITLSRTSSEYAWAPESFENQGPAYLDAVEVLFVPDASVGTGMLLSGQIDGIADALAEDFGRIDDAGMFRLDRAMPGMPSSYFLNVERGPLRSEAVRFALLHGLDRESTVPVLAGGYTVPATNVLSATTPGWADQSDLLEYDPEAATEALEDDGWELGDDGVRVKDGERLSLQVNYMTPSSLHAVPFLELAQQSYAELGIELTLNPISSAEDNELRAAGNYDLRYNGLSRGDADILTSTFQGMDSELDALLAEQAGSIDAEDRAAVVAEATAHILEHAYIIPVADSIQGQAYGTNVHGLVFDNTNTPSFSAVWLDD